ncbi:MAG: pilus assembly protein [Burkholderiales bacterium]|nr:pilus assembly protein [Burkholderiales bacterium]
MKRLRQRGAATVEFAVIAIVFFVLLLGMIQAGWLLFQWNAAADATRRGARTAAIVAMNDRAAIERAMLLPLAGLEGATVNIEYSPDGVDFSAGSCAGRGTCNYVRVSLAYQFRPQFVFGTLPTPIAMPTFSTTLPVEALGAG